MAEQTLAQFLELAQASEMLGTPSIAKHTPSINACTQASECLADACTPSIAQASGARGAAVRAAVLSPERRREIAQKASAARWAKHNKKQPIGFASDSFQHD